MSVVNKPIFFFHKYMCYCCLGCISDCLSKLTTGSGEKTMFNGYVLETLVLLVEVIENGVFSISC